MLRSVVLSVQGLLTHHLQFQPLPHNLAKNSKDPQVLQAWLVRAHTVQHVHYVHTHYFSHVCADLPGFFLKESLQSQALGSFGEVYTPVTSTSLQLHQIALLHAVLKLAACFA